MLANGIFDFYKDGKFNVYYNYCYDCYYDYDFNQIKYSDHVTITLKITKIIITITWKHSRSFSISLNHLGSLNNKNNNNNNV